MAKTTCEKCNKEFANNGFANHFPTCKGPKPPKKIRGIDFDPNAGYRTGERQAWNKGLTSADPRLKDQGRKISLALTGKPQNQVWSVEQRLKNSALQTERLKVGYASGSRKQAGGFVNWFEIDGEKVQGTWELRVAKILSKWKQEGKIKSWGHGKTWLKYQDENDVTRTYTPDFTVTRTNGVEYLIEVKGRIIPRDEHKWEAAKKLYHFEVWGLEKIKQEELSSLK
jgi:hypothetical protein